MRITTDAAGRSVVPRAMRERIGLPRPADVEIEVDGAAAFKATRGLRLGLAGHAWYETFSVLTRLPADQRRSPHEVVRAMRRAFPETRFLGPQAAASLSLELADLGISGGSVYDALVAATAKEHDRPLLTGDRRARATYDALGVQVRWVGPP